MLAASSSEHKTTFDWFAPETVEPSGCLPDSGYCGLAFVTAAVTPRVTQSGPRRRLESLSLPISVTTAVSQTVSKVAELPSASGISRSVQKVRVGAATSSLTLIGPEACGARVLSWLIAPGGLVRRPAQNRVHPILRVDPDDACSHAR
jgi:hypothetical protein